MRMRLSLLVCLVAVGVFAQNTPPDLAVPATTSAINSSDAAVTASSGLQHGREVRC